MEEEKPRSSKMSSRFGLILLAVALVFSGLGFMIGSAKGMPKTQQFSGPLAATKVGQNSVIKSQFATAIGTITKADGNSLTMQASGGDTETFKLSPQLQVYQPIVASSSAKTQASTNPSDIQLNKQTVVGLTWNGTEYLVTSVTYLQPPAAPVKK